MDRRKRVMMLAGSGLGLLLTVGAGCQNTRSDVPPGLHYSGGGYQAPATPYGGEGYAPSVGGFEGGVPASAAPSGTYGLPNEPVRYGLPSDHAYGPPGTALGGVGADGGASASPSSGWDGGAGAPAMPSEGFDPFSSAPAVGGAPSDVTGQPGPLEVPSSLPGSM